MKYSEFIASKAIEYKPSGFDPGTQLLNPAFAGDFRWQNDIVRWALRRGRAGVFPDTGLGKTIMQLVIAAEVVKHTGGRFILLAPLAVSRQTLAEAKKFGIDVPVKVCSDQSEVEDGITITNYEKLHKFDPSEFIGVGLDEGSILKSVDGQTRITLINMFGWTPYRFVFTATPSPNDIMEIGSYCEFLGIMTRSEMLAMFFTHDGGDTSKWRLKRHAEKDFYRWMASFCIMISNPSDIGYDGSRFILPPLRFHTKIVDCRPQPGYLFSVPDVTLHEQRATRRATIGERVSIMADIVNPSDEPWSVWCQLNDESKDAAAALFGAKEITGSQRDEEKEQLLNDFTDGVLQKVVTKSLIAGYGLNWQHCCKVGLLGIGHSYEQEYQLIRRHFRFGQTNPVDVYRVISDRDGGILENQERKHAQHQQLITGMVQAVSEQTRVEICGAKRDVTEYLPQQKLELPTWL